jgi:hypothetical protein
MWPVMAYLIGAVRAAAVFVPGLQRCNELSAGQVRQAATAAIRMFGCSGCAGWIAQRFGGHPETAVIRMCWARAMIREAVAAPAPELGRGANARAWLVAATPRSPEPRKGTCYVCRHARRPEPPPRLPAGRARGRKGGELGRQNGVACATWPGGLTATLIIWDVAPAY